VEVPALLMLRAFETVVLVAVTVKFPVTTRFPTETFPKLWNPTNAVRFPAKFVSLRTMRSCVLVVE
jgi:hypothetical protein